MSAIDGREELRQKLIMVLVKNQVPDAVTEVDAILGEYEIQRRSTEVALLSEDRNEYLFKKFLMAKIVKGCTDRTVKYYGSTLDFIFERIHKTADEVTADDIRYYMAVRQKKDGVSKVTIGNEQRVLGSFYTYLVSEEIICKNPMAKVERIKCRKKKKNAFTEIESEKIRDAAKNARERAIVEVLFSTGCRVTELVSIKISDIDKDKMIVHGKGEKDRMVYLNAKAVIAIERYLAERNDNNPYLFCGGYYVQEKRGCLYQNAKNGEWYKDAELVHPSNPADKGTIEQLMRRLKKRSGITSGCYPHKFRRTCATMALKRGMPIEQVSKMLGHENIATTQIYLDIDESELEQAHRKYVV
jgi:site-specific recombinase XerD